MEPRALAAALVTILFWASAFAAIRAGLKGLSPGHLVLVSQSAHSCTPTPHQDGSLGFPATSPTIKDGLEGGKIPRHLAPEERKEKSLFGAPTPQMNRVPGIGEDQAGVDAEVELRGFGLFGAPAPQMNRGHSWFHFTPFCLFRRPP